MIGRGMRYATAWFLTALALVLSGCGGKPITAPSSTGDKNGTPLSSAATGSPSPSNSERERVLIRFTWKLKGEYAPLYVTLDKGFFSEENLEVELAEGSGAQTVLQVLAAGTEHIGYGPAVSVAQGISRGIPVKVVALYQTAAPLAVISFPEKPVRKPKDLEGKRIPVTVGETFTDFLEPFARAHGVDINKIQRIQMDNSARTTQFMSKKVDVLSVYLNNELPVLEKQAGTQFVVMKVSDFGFQVPGASLFVSNQFLREKPDVVRRVIRAINKGFQYAMEHPEEAANIMNQHMSVKLAPDVILRQVQFTVEATNATPGRPIGWQDAGYWQRTLLLLKQTGAIQEVGELETYFTNDFNQG